MIGLRLGAVRQDDLDRLRGSEPTYDHVGSTLLAEGTSSADVYECQVTAGHGRAAFAAARDALREWRPQRSLGASITPDDVAPSLGGTVILGLGVGRLQLHVPNRVVAVVEEPDRYAYAYGTLPGHPERGEELFLVEIDPTDDRVLITIRVDARPAQQLRRLGFLVHPLQRFALRRYLACIAAAARAAGPH